ncbi:DUF6318 family protein [Rothia mucilaginosa]|jgi:hypothetical protein|uniref:DUF6318 family protein n=2 Tax=Rothia mucilaginosa TaxID=43675 RepID=UPI0028E31994|nr:DUF6318 family protein [Rothia mucilaginosa]
MDSTIFNRRTLLGSGALAGLGALLAACGQQANNEAAATASAAPSESASASAVASESPSASATPKPKVTRGYSGQSKAPDGEYRKADGYGPAQNVPKPRNEPAQYPETEEGLNHMMEDWVIAHNYAIQTGDCSYAFKYVTEDAEEYGFYEYLEDMYSHGGWIADGLDSYQSESALLFDDKTKEYRMKIRRVWSTAMYVEPDGEVVFKANTDTSDDSFYFIFIYSNGYWKIAGTKLLNEG